jgi:hypothetical protein
MPPISPSTLVELSLLLCSDVVDMAQKRCQCCVRDRLVLQQLRNTNEVDLLMASSSSSERMRQQRKQDREKKTLGMPGAVCARGSLAYYVQRCSSGC